MQKQVSERESAVLNWLKNIFRRDVKTAVFSNEDRLKQSYQAINEAAGDILQALGPALTNTAEGHIQTDIAAASCLAGSVILRETVADVESYTAGQAILADTHHRQAELLSFMVAVSHEMELNVGDWDGSVPTEHAPMLEVVPMIERLQGPLEQTMARHHIPSEFRAHVCALAATKLVAAGHRLGILDQRIGKAIASYYLVAGSKTVPQAPRWR